MNHIPINPEKIKHPFQLLAVWLASLIILEGIFLTTVVQMKEYLWVTITLVITAIVIIPGFLYCIFLLQTKFRPEMLNDESYTQYLQNQSDKFQEQEDSTKAQEEVANIIQGMPPTTYSNLNWSKIATLFWFGNDLMWIQDMTYRDAPPELVIQGVNIALQYAYDLGFPNNSLPIQNLLIVKTIIQLLIGIVPSSEEEMWILKRHYRTVQQYVETVKWFVSAQAKMQQPDFEKLRAVYNQELKEEVS